MPYSMRVQKRDGTLEPISFDKVLSRVRKAARGLLVNSDALAQEVLSRIYDGVPTTQLDELTAANAASLGTVHPDWATLASRIAISNHQKKTEASFVKVVNTLSQQTVPKTGEATSYIAPNLLAFVNENAAAIDAYINHQRDYLLDYFGFKTLEKSYLLKDTKGQIIERPQHMWMRVALALWVGHPRALEYAFQTYDLMSQKCMTHATPTLFNAGTPLQQLSSCYLLAMHEDSIAGIYKTLGDCAAISKYAGGIGLHVHNIRARGSLIRGTNGMSNGLVPMLRVFNNTARYVDQCFTPDTVIYTMAGIKKIEDVGVTDKVLTSKGKYDNVKTPIRHEYDGPILEIQVKNAVYPVRVTPEHQILALRGQPKGLNFDVIRNRLEKGYAEPEFTDARDLAVGDFLVFPVPQYECDIPSLTEDDCRLYGILLGDGYISNNMAGISVNNTTKQGIYDFVLNYITKRGITVYPEQEGVHSLKLRWSIINPGFKFTASQLYDANKQKHVDTPFLHLPHAKLRQIVRGLLETDGCIGEKEISFEVSSYPLMEGLRYMLLRMGALTSGYERNRLGNVSSTRDIHTNLPSTVLLIPRIPDIMKMFPNAPKSEYFLYLRHGNNIYTRIQSITETKYSGVVHDFEIEGPHDYTVAHLGVAHNGGGRRNGSFAIYLEPWHADIEDFLKLKLNSGAEEERARDLFYALWISDLFMERVEADGEWSLFCPSEAPGLADVWGADFNKLYTDYEAKGLARKTVKAQKLWFQILDAQMETGTPYLVYKDAANKKSNQQNLGTIKSSNLCVAPETYILTDKGQFQIHKLENQEVTVWNGDVWSKTTVRKTGVQQRLLTVTLSNGAEIHCTPYHKFIIREEYTDKGSLKDAIRVDAAKLKEGMKMAKCELGLVEGNPEEDIPYPYTHGFLCGDGILSAGLKNSTKICSLYGEKINLLDKLAIKSTSGIIDLSGRLNAVLDQSIPEKFYVPMNASLKCRLDWLAGLMDADGVVVTNGDNESLHLASIEYEFLDRIRLVLQTLGVQSKVVKLHDARQTLMPDGKGGRKLFDFKPIWRILIGSAGLFRLKNLGFTCHRLIFRGSKPQRNDEQFVTVVSVIDNGRVDDTYCFNEPENHAGIFNGVLTGNCSEILEYSNPQETAVCNLASLALPAFVKNGAFDFAELRRVVGITIRNLNRVIDINYYPTPETRRSNMRHRPVGLGVQGLADVFAILRLSWEDEAALELNQLIFEHMYYAAVSMSCELAHEEGVYETFRMHANPYSAPDHATWGMNEASPAANGKLQPDLWGVTPLTETRGELDWRGLRVRASQGMRNSLLIAPMPTASTSQILGYNECFEPFTSNLYSRRTLAGEFVVVNKYLMKELLDLGLWNEEMKQNLVARNGSVQGVPGIPEEIEARYKTTWELKQRILIDMAAARGAFICQSQSLNLFVADPNYGKLTSMHFYAWKKGLKTGCYYLRTKAPVAAQKFTVDPRLMAAISGSGGAGGGGASTNSLADDDVVGDDDSSSESEKEEVPQTAVQRRQALKERLAAEYEAEVKAAREAAEKGEGCLMCSS